MLWDNGLQDAVGSLPELALLLAAVAAWAEACGARLPVSAQGAEPAAALEVPAVAPVAEPAAALGVPAVAPVAEPATALGVPAVPQGVEPWGSLQHSGGVRTAAPEACAQPPEASSEALVAARTLLPAQPSPTLSHSQNSQSRHANVVSMHAAVHTHEALLKTAAVAKCKGPCVPI